jgi:quercetin dioxygenase-like cupin family protein
MYQTLDDSYFKYLKTQSLENITSNYTWNLNVHDWLDADKNDLLNEVGLKYFENYKLQIFRIPPHYQGPIHKDKAQSVINFVIKGQGYYNFYSENSLKIIRYNRGNNPIYDEKAVPLFTVDTNKGSVIRIFPRVPHRLVCTSDEERIAISLRK